MDLRASAQINADSKSGFRLKDKAQILALEAAITKGDDAIELERALAEAGQLELDEKLAKALESGREKLGQVTYARAHTREDTHVHRGVYRRTLGAVHARTRTYARMHAPS